MDCGRKGLAKVLHRDGGQVHTAPENPTLLIVATYGVNDVSFDGK